MQSAALKVCFSVVLESPMREEISLQLLRIAPKLTLEITLSYRHALLTKDVVSSNRVEVEIRQEKRQQVSF